MTELGEQLDKALASLKEAYGDGHVLVEEYTRLRELEAHKTAGDYRALIAKMEEAVADTVAAQHHAHYVAGLEAQLAKIQAKG